MIRVLIVDDSAVVRQLLAGELSRAVDISVVGAASDPYAARDKILRLRPDVLTLDIEMPRMDGLTFLMRLMRYYPMPVVIVSSLSPGGSELALRALDWGAVDVVAKPQSPAEVGAVAARVVASIRSAARAGVIRGPGRVASPDRPPRPPKSIPLPVRAGARVIAMGASTGGTEAIRHILQELPATIPPLLVVQHMPAGFTRAFAERLNQTSALEVREAAGGDVLRSGLALIAPGDTHLVLKRRDTRFEVEVKNGPRVCHQRPSVDVLFHSMARGAKSDGIGVLLTGMGADGASGLLAMRQAGAVTLAQDEESSVVFGMPREAIGMGAAEDVVPLEQMSARILEAAAAEPRPR